VNGSVPELTWGTVQLWNREKSGEISRYDEELPDQATNLQKLLFQKKWFLT
jgi:hypothetical protein